VAQKTENFRILIYVSLDLSESDENSSIAGVLSQADQRI
jgi:hypothetical protein